MPLHEAFRHLRMVLIGGALTSASLVAGTAVAADDSAAVAATVEKMRAAMLASDGTTLKALTDDGLSYGHSSGRLQDKAAFIKELDGTHSLKSLSLSNQTIQLIGDIAIVRHVWDSQNARPDGTVSTPHIGALQVWKKQAGNWRLLARQAYTLPKP